MKCPRCDGEMRIVDYENGDKYSEDGKMPCPNCYGDGEVMSSEYIHLKIPNSDFNVQVKMEEEGIVVDVFNGDDDVVTTTYAEWNEMVTDEWGITLLELLNKQHNPEFM